MRVLLVLAAVTLLLLCGTAWHVAVEQSRSAGCEMTYMYANYKEVHVQRVAESDKRYKLYLYREDGGPSKQAMPPTGHPVLFIPGNAGSYQQVRSIASETSREWARRKTRREAAAGGGHPGGPAAGKDLDWYVLDTNEELSAFDSVLLEHQARFALACLRHLAAAYNLRPRGAANATAGGPAGAAAAATGGGVLLFGHSMGGVVARLLLLEAWRDPELGPGSVSLLVTLSSPQAASPVMLHPAMGRLYARLGARPLPVGVPVVSINGGARDVQVAEPLTSLDGVTIDASHAFEAATLDMPGVWAQAGHNEIAWCNQLLRRLSVLLLALCEGRRGGAGAGAAEAAAAAKERKLLEAALPRPPPPPPPGTGRRGPQGAHGLLLLDSSHEAPQAPPRPRRRTMQLPPVQGAAAAAKAVPSQGQSRARHRWPRRLPRDTDAALIMYRLQGRVAHSLAATPAAAAAAASWAAAWRASAADPNGTAVAAAGQQLLGTFWGPWAALDPSVGPRACRGHGLGWHKAQLEAEEVATTSMFVHGSHLDDGRGNLFTWDARRFTTSQGGDIDSGGGDGSGSSTDGDSGSSGDGLLLTISAAKPCDGFRLWLELEPPGGGAGRPRRLRDEGGSEAPQGQAGAGEQQQQQQQGGAGVADPGTVVVDLSHAAAMLPCLDDAAALSVKDAEKWQEVLRGRDYLAGSAWLLRVPPPLLAHARRIYLWVAPRGKPGGDGGTPAWTAASVQWLRHWPAPGMAAAAAPRRDPGAGEGEGEARLAPWSVLLPARRAAGGPAVVHLQLRWPWLSRHLSLRWAASRPAAAQQARLPWLRRAHPHGGAPGDGDGGAAPAAGCWRPALVSSDASGDDEHVRANMSALPLHFHLHAWPGAHQGGGGAPMIVAVLDPRCNYSLWLGLDVFAPLWTLLLGYSSVAVGLMVALLLLALSHQLSALVQLSAQEAGVQLLDGFHGSGHSIGLGGHGGFGLSGGGGDGGASGRQSPAAALGSRAVSRARSAPVISLGGANLAPPAATSFPRSLDAVLGDRRVWLGAAALLALLLSAERLADGGGHHDDEDSSGADADNALLLRLLRRAVRFALAACGLSRLAPRPPAAGVAFLALAAVTLLMINAQLAVLLKCLCGGWAAVVLRVGRSAFGATGMGAGSGAGSGGGGTSDGARTGAPAGMGETRVGRSAEEDGCGPCDDACPTGLFSTPTAVLRACVAGPPGGKLPLGCGAAGAGGCLPEPPAGLPHECDSRCGGGVGVPLLRLLLGAIQLAVAAAMCMPHPAIGLALATSALFITWTPQRITNFLVRLSLPEFPLSALAAPPRRAAAPPPRPVPPHPSIAVLEAQLAARANAGADGGAAFAASAGAAAVRTYADLAADPASSAAPIGPGAPTATPADRPPSAALGLASEPWRALSPLGPARGGGGSGGSGLPNQHGNEGDGSDGGGGGGGGGGSGGFGTSLGGASVARGGGGGPLVRRGLAVSRSSRQLAGMDEEGASDAPNGDACRPAAGATDTSQQQQEQQPWGSPSRSGLMAAAQLPRHQQQIDTQQPPPPRGGSGGGGGGGRRAWSSASPPPPSDEVVRMQQLMHQGWLLLYGCCLMLMLPSLAAWAQLPLGQQHLAHPLDAFVCAPILLHCIALARGDSAAYSGLPAGWFGAAPGASAAPAGATTGRGRRPGGGGPLPAPHLLHKRCLRWLAAYVFLASLQSGACGALAACSSAAALMLAGRAAAAAANEGWHLARVALTYRFEPDFQVKKQG